MSETDKELLIEKETSKKNNKSKEKINKTTKKNKQESIDKTKNKINTPAKEVEKKKTTANKDTKNTSKKNVESAKNKQAKKEITKKTTKSRRRRNRKTKRNKNNRLIIIFIIILVLVLIVSISFLLYKNNQAKQTELKQNELKEDILKHYNQYVITNKETDIYTLSNSKYTKVGTIATSQELTLDTKDITYEDEYFKITTFDEDYYIYYQDADVIEELTASYSTRYKNYIIYNQNIITEDTTNFYDEEDNLIYTFNTSFDLPIIVNKKDTYGVEFNNRLLYVKQEDVSEVKENHNTDSSNTDGIAVLNYHFFYDNNVSGDAAKCNQIICLSTDNLKKHLDYIKDNNIFTPNMEELEMYIDGYIQLPKSVVLTIDDGWRADIGSNIMAEYEINATVFLISSGYDPNAYKNEYVEVHSHGHNLHNPGVCSGGQGGAIKCLDKTKLLADLATSREKLDNTTVFCYPFYEYNDYSIEVLKEAGFTMAFAGYGEDRNYKAKPGINKYKIPRYVIYNNTTINDIVSYIN